MKTSTIGTIVSGLALAIALAANGEAHAQEVRGPESPAETSNAPSPAATASGTAPGATPAAAPQGLEDIVVTARKVSENLQNVPVAITAFSGAALQQQGATQVADVAKLTPGLVIRESASAGSASLFQIRGQYQSDVLATLDPSVGVYVDGYYWARAYGINADLLDIQSVQTLKGPQGTLFGRNTTGGAILIQTNDPSFRGFSALASGTYGRFNQWSGTGVVNVPVIDDKLAIRLAYQRNDRDGYVTDSNSGAKLGGKHDYTVRGKLLYKPTHNLSILLEAEQYRTKYLNNPYREEYVGPTSPANLAAVFETPSAQGCIANGLATCYPVGNALSQKAAAAANSGDTVALNVLPQVYAKTQTFTGTITLDTFFGALKAIGGYRNVKSDAAIDLDGGPYNILATLGRQDLSQYSAEFQATGKALDNRIDFAAGVFAFKEYGSDSSSSSALTALNPSIQSFNNYISNSSMGMYGQATYHMTDRLSFTGGLRYSFESKNLTSGNGNYSSGTYAGPTAGAVFTCSRVTCPDVRHANFGGLSYTAGLDYKLTNDILLYAKTARGFRSGGQNARGTRFFPGSTDSFKPEQATSYEGGVKTELFDRRVRLNAAGYYSTINNIQRSSLVADQLGNTATVISNAGKAVIYGGELEADALLFGGFRLGGSLAYTHPEYKTYTDPVTGFDKSHERFDNTPTWTASVSPSFTHEFGFGKFMIRGDFIYQAKTALYNNGYYVDSAGVTRDASNGAVTDPTVAANMLKASTDPAGWVINGRTSMTLMQDKLEVAVWGKNLANRRDLIVALPISSLTEVAGIRREPRTVGVTVTVKFGAL